MLATKRESSSTPRTGLPLWDARKVLEYPAIYNLFQRLVGADKPRRHLIEQIVAPLAPARVLEVGCGPGTNCAWIPRDIEYVGCDLSESYIMYARQRYGDRAQFFAAPVGQLAQLKLKPFKAVIALNLLHHLDDDAVLTLCDEIIPLLEPGGTFVTADPCIVPGQSHWERFVTSCDRGRYVRFPEQYHRLFAARFRTVAMEVGRSSAVLTANAGVLLRARAA
jgi:SAM-dependent methyltransferase